MPKITNSPSDVSADPHQFALAGQQIMLDTLRAEFGALQALMPGLSRREAKAETATNGSDTAEAMFDNMPV